MPPCKVAYMTHDHAVEYIKFYLWCRNQPLLQKARELAAELGLEGH